MPQCANPAIKLRTLGGPCAVQIDPRTRLEPRGIRFLARHRIIIEAGRRSRLADRYLWLAMPLRYI